MYDPKMACCGILHSLRTPQSIALQSESGSAGSCVRARTYTCVLVEVRAPPGTLNLYHRPPFGGMSEPAEREIEPLVLPDAAHSEIQPEQPQRAHHVLPPIDTNVPHMDKSIGISAMLSRTGEIHYFPEIQGTSSKQGETVPMRRRMSDISPHMEPLSAGFRLSRSEHSTPLLGPRDGTPSWRRKQHTGSAIEAISALLLQRNGAGRLDELSLRKSSTSSNMPSLPLSLWLRTIGPRRLVFYAVEYVTKLLYPTPEYRDAGSPGRKQQTTRLAWGESLDNETPPTPVAMPGAFMHSYSETLLLPPPLLDEGSDPLSFEGILGVRHMREKQQRQQFLDQLNDRNRPAQRAGTFKSLSNFVKAAKASEARKQPQLRRHKSTGITGGFFDMRYFRQRRRMSIAPSLKRTESMPMDRMNPVEEYFEGVPPASPLEPVAPLDLDSGASVGAPVVPPAPDTGTSTSPEPTVRLTPLAMLNDAGAEISPRVPIAEPLKSLKEDKTSLGAAWVFFSVLFVGVTAVPDFAVFIMAYIIDFVAEIYNGVLNALWFIRWLWMNVTGRTVLGRYAIEAYVLIQGEWAYVAKEDHEGRYERSKRLSLRRRGLGAFQVLRGLIELICLQSVTRERYQRESGGLELLRGWRSTDANDCDDNNDETDLYITGHSVDIVEISRTGQSSGTRAHGLWTNDSAAFVGIIKWALRLAVSAYGLRVLIVDMPPVFTPSGQKFPHQTFAHLSRLDANDVLHAEIQAMDSEEVYSPTFYIVRDMIRQVVCVAVRGTQSFADVIVDLDMLSEDVTDALPEWHGVPRKNPSAELVFHAGIWRAAKALVAPGSTFSTKLKEVLAEHPGFGLVFVGHSLGAAIASAVAILLSEYHVEDESSDDPRRGIWRTHGNNGIPAGRRIRAISFANPSVVSEALAKRTAYGTVPLITSVIYRHDILPRFGHGQVRELRRILGALTRVRHRCEMASTTVSKDPSHMVEHEDAVVHIISRFWDWCSICRTKEPDAVMRDKRRRIEEQFWRLRCEVEDDLFARAKWRYDNAEELRTEATVPEVRDAPLHKRTTRRQRLDAATLFSEAAQGGPLIPPGEVYWVSDGEIYRVRSPLSFFSVPDFQPSMLLDHFPAAYEEAVLSLGAQKSE